MWEWREPVPLFHHHTRHMLWKRLSQSHWHQANATNKVILNLRQTWWHNLLTRFIQRVSSHWAMYSYSSTWLLPFKQMLPVAASSSTFSASLTPIKRSGTQCRAVVLCCCFCRAKQLFCSALTTNWWGQQARVCSGHRRQDQTRRCVFPDKVIAKDALSWSTTAHHTRSLQHETMEPGSQPLDKLCGSSSSHLL